MTEQKRFMAGRWSAVTNMGLLLGGYGAGQGAMFVAQTWLLATGRYHFLAAFGTHFLFAVLGTYVVDAGAITILARHAAGLPRDAASRLHLWQLFWDTSVFRAVLAVALALAAVIYASVPAADGFSRNYALFAAPALLFFAGNAAGLLDGFKFGGISGLTGAIPYATSALALAIVRDASPETAGATLGTAFSVGCLLTVATQWIVLARFGWRPRWLTTTGRGVGKAARDGIAMLGVMLPGQFYGRAQLLLSAAYLGPETTAIFLYAKQVINVIAQTVGFIQRVEFPGLVTRLSVPDGNLLRTIVSAQKLVAAFGVVSTMGVCSAGFAMAHMPENRFTAVAALLIGFSPTILTMAAVIMMTQALAAGGAYEGLAVDIFTFNVVGLAASYFSITGFGVYAFVAGDLISTLFGVVLLSVRLGRSKQVAPLTLAQRP